MSDKKNNETNELGKWRHLFLDLAELEKDFGAQEERALRELRIKATELLKREAKTRRNKNHSENKRKKYEKICQENLQVLQNCGLDFEVDQEKKVHIGHYIFSLTKSSIFDKKKGRHIASGAYTFARLADPEVARRHKRRININLIKRF